MDVGPRASGNAMYTTDLWSVDVNAILGQFFDDRLRRVYETLTDNYCSRNKGSRRISSTQEVMKIPKGCSEKGLHAVFKENFASVVDEVIIDDLGKSFPMDKKTLLLKHLPRDIPCSNLLEVYKVPENDPRIPLRGQNGLRVTKTATKGLPAGAFIGVYRGKSLIDLDEYKDVKFVPPGVDYLQFELEIESYTASAEHFNAEAEKNRIHFEATSFSLHVCAARYGNITALVNDPSLEPMIYTNFEKVGEDNTCLVEIIVGGWPCIAMFASKAINPGEELRYSYGQSFWKYVHAATKRLSAPRGKGNLNGNGNLGGNGSGDGSIRDALAAADDVGPLVNDAATPMRSRNPHSQPSAAAAAPAGTGSDLPATEEQHNGDDNDDDDDDGNGADSRKRIPRQVVGNGKVTPVKSKPQRQPKTADKALPKEKPRQNPGHRQSPKKRKKNQPEKTPKKKKIEAEKQFDFTPTKKMMSSPHGKRMKIYSKTTPNGKFQAEHGFASQKQYEAVQRLVKENPKIESGDETEEDERENISVEATRNKRPSSQQSRKPRSTKGTKAERKLYRDNLKKNGSEILANGATTKMKDATNAAEGMDVKKEIFGNGGDSRRSGGHGGGAQSAQPTTDEDSEINRLTAAVEAGNEALNIAKTKLKSAVKMVDQCELKVAELLPEEDKADESTETPQATPPAATMAAQPGDELCLLWTKTRIFALFRQNEQGNEVLVGPWDVSQLENALDLNQAPSDTEVFIYPYLDRSDEEIEEALQSLGLEPTGGMWKLAELLDLAHPEALAAETPVTAAATRTAAAARTAKTKGMDLRQGRQLKEAKEKRKEALEKVKEKEKLVKEKEEAVALAEKELGRALGEDEDDEEEEVEALDPEVAKLNERSAGKRPALENGPSGSGSGGGYPRANGNGIHRGAKLPKLTASPITNYYNAIEKTIGADGAGTSAAHAAAATAKLAGKGDGVGAALSPQKAPAAAAAPADDNVVDLTFDSD